MSPGPLRIGTRRSPLAWAQAGALAEALRAHAGGREVTLVPVVTEGDRDARALTTLGGSGVFVTAVRERLLAGDVDVAVHSLKDLPTAAEPALALAAVPAREDPRDVLVSRGDVPLAALPGGAVVGTGSPRRAAQLRGLGRGLSVVGVRGNVDTRVGKVRSGELDAVVLAAAGLHRLGRAGEAAQTFDVDTLMPAPGQGALAVECRADDETARALLAGLDDAPTRAAVTAERALLAALAGGCAAPVAAYAEVVDDGRLRLRALVAATDGSAAVRSAATAELADAAGVGVRLAHELLELGAADLIGSAVAGPGMGESP